MKYDITFHPQWWHENAGIDFTQDFFDNPKYRIECDMKMRKVLYEHFGAYGLGEKAPKERPLLGSDLLAAGYLYAELMGCKIRYEADNSPQVKCLELDADDMDEIEVPVLAKSPVWERTAKQIRYLLDKFGYVLPCVNLMGIQNVAMDLMGQELLVAYYTDDMAVRRLLSKITDLFIQAGKEFLALSHAVSGGVTSIVRKTCPEIYLTSNCSVEMISNELYETFLLEHDMRLAETFGAFGIHHCGQTMEHVAEGYAKVRGLTFAEVGAGSDIRAVRKKMPGVYLNARYSPVRLLEATASQMEEEIQELVKKGQENGSLLSVSCVGIDKSVLDQQIIHFLNACKNAGE